jgi:hypothetical protein
MGEGWALVASLPLATIPSIDSLVSVVAVREQEPKSLPAP